MNQEQPSKTEFLRQQAESLLQTVDDRQQNPSVEDIRHIFHELQVHQIELELQNEELRTMQKFLEESRSRFMHLFHQAPVGYVVLNNSGLITEINVTFADMIERDRATLLGKPFAKLLNEEDRPLFLARFKALLKNPEDKQMEVRLATEKASALHVCISTSPNHPGHPFSSHKEPELFLTITDISARKKAEEALLTSERLARSTVDALTANIAILDEHGTILFVNHSWREFARNNGVNPDKVGEGTNYFATCATAVGQESEEAKTFAEGIRRVIREEIDHYSYEYACHSSTENRWFTGRVSRFPGQGTHRIVVAHENITPQKQLEQENLQLQRQLHRREKEESLSRMAGAIAHHFNNQLFAVMGNLELAMETTLSRTPESLHLEAAMDSLHKAAELSNRMLTYLGINTKGKQLIDLSTLCRSLLPALLTVKPVQVRLESRFPPSGPMLEANPDQLRELATNLIENSWEAMANREGTLWVSISTVADVAIDASRRLPLAWSPTTTAYACLEVKDEGCGMLDKEIERIFDPFYSKKFLGRGMGLPLVLGIIRAHGGCITVHSQPEVGTTVRVYLPIMPPEHNESAETVTHVQ